MKDYRNTYRIGMANTHSDALKPTALAMAKHLEAAIPHAEALGCYVDGRPLEDTLRRIIGNLQHCDMVPVSPYCCECNADLNMQVDLTVVCECACSRNRCAPDPQWRNADATVMGLNTLELWREQAVHVRDEGGVACIQS